MDDRKPQDQDKFVLRLPDGMRDRIKAKADANSRSMNAEIVARLEASLSPASAREDAQEYARIYGQELIKALARDFPKTSLSAMAASFDAAKKPKE